MAVPSPQPTPEPTFAKSSGPTPSTAAYDALPPPGFARNEELKRRDDMLNKQIDTWMQQYESGTIDPRAFKEDREILYHYERGNIPVTNQDPTYCYAWIYRDPHNRYGGQAIVQKQVSGWEVVSGSMPEAAEKTNVDGYRIVGDTLLMRISVDKWLIERHALIRRRMMRKRTIIEPLNELVSETTRKHGNAVRLHEYDRDEMKQAAAQQHATVKTDQWIREGRMPGAALPEDMQNRQS